MLPLPLKGGSGKHSNARASGKQHGAAAAEPKPTTRADLVAEIDAAIEHTAKCRIELGLAERAMVAAREALERFDAEAQRRPPPIHGH